jgi:hypothetical protein
MKLIDKTASNPVMPLMGALYLKPLDGAVAETGLFLRAVHGRLAYHRP